MGMVIREESEVFRAELARRQEEAETVIRRYLPDEKGMQKTLLAAMNYSVRCGGKRIRPVLMKLAFDLFGGTGEIVEPFMAAMEMIHTASLIHDDLPALDNDDLRRGHPTSHKKFGEAMAVLAGDGLQNYAYETAAKAFAIRSADPDTERAYRILARKSGIYGMLGGQSVDVELDGQPLSEETMEFIYRYKTGALLEGSLMIGAQLAGAGEDDVLRMEQIGRKTGLAFQIRDDMLDVEGQEELLGKPIGSDRRNEKTTYVSCHGIKEAGQKVAGLTEEAVALLRDLPGDHTFFEDLLVWMISRQH